MKLYDWKGAPNPRRVVIFLAEKGLPIPIEQAADETLRLKPEFITKYPHAMVPMLELDDGTQLGEAMAICRYLESLHPDPPLMGVNAKDAAIIEMWERRANDEGFLAAAEVFRNTHPAFVDRGLPGTLDPIPQLPELITRGRARMERFFRKFDTQLAGREFVASDRFTVADITTLTSVDFAKWSGMEIPEDCLHLRRWHAAVSARPSAQI